MVFTVRACKFTSVAHCAFDNTAGSPGRINAQEQVVHVVEGVKHAENVHAFLVRHLAKLEDDIVRVCRVAHGVGTAEQHLEGDVWHGLSHALQAVPGTLVQEAHGDVKRGSTPCLQRVEVCKVGMGQEGGKGGRGRGGGGGV